MSTLIADGVVVELGGFSLGPVNLSLGPGVHHIRGDNGSGKTTLLRALCGDLRPAKGMVRVDGGDPWTDPAARARVSWVPTHPQLPGFLTVDEAWQMMAALRNAPDWQGDDYRSALGLPGELRLEHASVGQRHRAELLAGIAADPGVLLLDEPLASLDPRGQHVITVWLKRWRAERVVLLTSHEPLPIEADSTGELVRGQPFMHSGW